MSGYTLRRLVAALALATGVTAGLPQAGQAQGGGCVSGQWTVMSTPTLASWGYLQAVNALSASDIWAAGSTAATAVSSVELFEHWDGTQWSVVPGVGVPGAVIYGLAGASSADVWAFGSANGSTLIEHWDGSAWHVVPNPTQLRGTMLGGVALGSDDVWAVGNTGSGSNDVLHVVRWNGTAWLPVQSFGAAWFDTGAIAASSDADVWIADATVTQHWDGTAWTATSAVAPSPGTVDLQTIAVAGAQTRWAGGYNDGPAGPAADLQSWNGGAWSNVPLPSGVAARGRLTGMSAASASDAWAVGWRQPSTGGDVGIAEHWDGTQWTSVPPATPAGFIDPIVAVAAQPGRAWAVGRTASSYFQPSNPMIQTWCA
jgi:hypothetical protein